MCELAEVAAGGWLGPQAYLYAWCGDARGVLEPAGELERGAPDGLAPAAPRILYCNCSYAKVVPPEVKEEVLRQLCASGIAFDAVADLCDMSARKDPALKKLVDSGAVRIAGCIRMDMSTNMLESHRQMPVSASRAMLGYLFGTTVHVFAVVLLNVIVLAILELDRAVRRP